jgi:hypothetical protein
MPTQEETVQEIDLRGLAREVLDTSGSADLHAVADEVYARIHARDRAAALRQALPIVVKQLNSLDRSHPSAGDTHAGAVRPVQGPSRPTRTSATRLREAWQVHLAQRFPAIGGDKFLRDFTVADVDFAITVREEHLARVAATTARFRAIRKALAEAGVEKVGDLPEDTLRELFNDAEAA